MTIYVSLAFVFGGGGGGGFITATATATVQLYSYRFSLEDAQSNPVLEGAQGRYIAMEGVKRALTIRSYTDCLLRRTAWGSFKDELQGRLGAVPTRYRSDDKVELAVGFL